MCRAATLRDAHGVLVMVLVEAELLNSLFTLRFDWDIECALV